MTSYARSRRDFIARLGLGAGATLLSPIVETLVSEAQGQVARRQRVVFFLTGCGIPRGAFTPAGVTSGATDYPWPSMLQALEPFRSRILLTDGLSCQAQVDGHTICSAVLTNYNIAPYEAPGSISIDQFIANQIGSGTRHRSLQYGMRAWGGDGQLSASITSLPTLAIGPFAAAKNKLAMYHSRPGEFFNHVFGMGTGSAPTVDPAARERESLKRRVLFDSIRADLKRLQGALAGTERAKLDQYLAAIEAVQMQASAPATTVSCKAPTAPGTEDQKAYEANLNALHDQATAALVCGLTNVVGAAVYTGNSHVGFLRNYAWGGMGEAGLHTTANGPFMIRFVKYHMGLVARMATTLASIKEGDSTILDNTVIVALSDNADEHHSDHLRFPVIVLGSAGGKLRTDGRYIRFPTKGSSGAHTLADLWCTLAAACGVPGAQTFGAGGVEAVQGPLATVMA
jgi:hypothetical protein